MQRTDPSFDARRSLLVGFRDRVFLRVLGQLNYPVVEWEALLFTLMLETADASPDFANFQKAAQRLLHQQQIEEVRCVPSRAEISN